MDDRRPSPPITNGPGGLTIKEQLELRIKILEQEIPFYSNKAAEAMVQGVEDNTFKIETERRLEELNRSKEELKRLNLVNESGGAIPPPPLQPSPHISQGTLPMGSPHVASQPNMQYPGMNVQQQKRPHPLATGPAMVPGQPQMAPMPGSHHPQQQQQQQAPHIQLTRKQKAVLGAENRVRNSPVQDSVFLCSVFLEYSDLIASACVNKYWRNRFRMIRFVLHCHGRMYVRLFFLNRLDLLVFSSTSIYLEVLRQGSI
jgi:hypothetical protein